MHRIANPHRPVIPRPGRAAKKLPGLPIQLGAIAMGGVRPLARFIWQSTETADALRTRVFELRFPSRLLEEEGADHALIELFAAVKNSPSVPAFLLSVGKVLLPALRDAFQEYLQASEVAKAGAAYHPASS